MSDGTLAGCSTGYPKPSWQTGPGVPADGVRDLPDVSLFASQGRTNTFYIVCQQDRDPDGKPCNLDFPYSDFAAYGGTEIAAPAFAGILALAVQRAGTRIGNPNLVLYTLAARQDAAGTACDSTASNASGCVFHDITQGTNAMPCVTGSPDCVTADPADQVGILSAPGAAPGYDLSSGLGSVNAYNLVESYNTVTFAPTSAILSISPSSVVHGSPVVANVVVSGGTGSPTGEVSLNAGTSAVANGSVGSGPLVNGAFSQTFRNFPGGSYGVQAYYAGDATDAPSDSNFVSLTVTPEPSSTSIETLAFDPATRTAAVVTAAPYGNIYYIRVDVQGKSGQGTATGNINLDDNGTIFGSGIARLNSSGYTEGQNNSLAPGTHVFSAQYEGDPSFQPSSAPPATLVISQAPTTTSLSTSASTVSNGGVLTLNAIVNTQSYGYMSPSGTVTFFSGSTALGTSQLTGGYDPATYFDRGTASLTLSAGNLAPGSDSITAVYAGDVNYLGSSSPASRCR